MKLARVLVLLPAGSLENLRLERPSDEADQLLGSYSALFHPAVLAASGELPHWLAAESLRDAFELDAEPEVVGETAEPSSEGWSTGGVSDGAASIVAPSGPPRDLRCLVIPPCCEEMLTPESLAPAENQRTHLIRYAGNRGAVLQAALAWAGQLSPPAAAADASRQGRDAAVDGVADAAEDSAGAAAPEPMTDESAADLAADFMALGYCHLVVELLTRQLRFMTHLDDATFEAIAVRAARAAQSGDELLARRELEAAFALLNQNREYYYPVESHTLDLTLIAEGTAPVEFDAGRAAWPARNLLVGGRAIEGWAARSPASLPSLREALRSGAASIAGGEFAELPLPLMPPEAIRANLLRGLHAYIRHLDWLPSVFGRRRYGLTPILPQVLHNLAFTGALHGTLDDGRFPVPRQCRIRWEGVGGASIEAVARVPFEAARTDVFLQLPDSFGSALDLDHLSTMVFAHWPGIVSPWYDDLQRIARYTSVLGKFTTIDEYFQDGNVSGQGVRFKADEYRAPYLKQAIESGMANPISRWVRYYARRALAESADALSIIAYACGAPREDDDWMTEPAVAASVAAEAPAERAAAGESDGGETAAGRDMVMPPYDRQLARVDDLADAADDRDDELDALLQSRLSDAAARAAAALGGGSLAAPSPSGWLVLSPLSFAASAIVDGAPLATLPKIEPPVIAADADRTGTAAVIECPPIGFAWLGPTADATSAAGPSIRASSAAQSSAAPRRILGLFGGRSSAPNTMVQENRLRNEFLGVTIDRRTGAIRAVDDGRSRGPRIAQQLALRRPSPDAADAADDVHYSIMAADSIELGQRNPMLAEAVSRGRLMSRRGERLAGFQQTTRVRRGSRVIEVEVEIEPDALPEGNPWSNYYGARFAWGDETADIYRSVNMLSLPTELQQFESPHFVEVRWPKSRVTLLCGGLPYHRRFGLRKLDTPLIVAGERTRRFRFGIGIDLPNPMPAAIEFLAPPIQLAAPRPPASQGWLFHLGSPGVLATHWAPLWADAGVESTTAANATAPLDRLDGVRVRLLETEGRRVRCALRAFAALRAAARCERIDAEPVALPVEGDRVTVELASHQWVEVELRFAPRA